MPSIVLIETETCDRLTPLLIYLLGVSTHSAVLNFSCLVLAASREQKTAARNTTFEDTANSEYIAPTAIINLTFKKFTLTRFIIVIKFVPSRPSFNFVVVVCRFYTVTTSSSCVSEWHVLEHGP